MGGFRFEGAPRLPKDLVCAIIEAECGVSRKLEGFTLRCSLDPPASCQPAPPVDDFSECCEEPRPTLSLPPFDPNVDIPEFLRRARAPMVFVNLIG
jgi:hypothetical protein